MNNKTVKELRIIAKELNITKAYALNKEQLIEAISAVQKTVTIEETFDSVTDKTDKARTNTSDLQSNRTVSMFDVERYAKFVPKKELLNYPILTQQYNLVKSLENNFKVKINIEDCKNAYELSGKLCKVYEAIINGKVQYRSEEEILERVKAYKPSYDNKPTMKQLNKITQLEKQTGVMNTVTIKDKQTASKVIANYLKIVENQTQQLSEVAVDSVETNRFEDKTFRTKFVAMMKRIFA